MLLSLVPRGAAWSFVIMVVPSLALSVARGQTTDPGDTTDQAEVRQQLAEQVDDLLLELAADTIAERDIAEQNLVKLGELGAIPLDDFLAMLPADSADLPPAVRDRIKSVRGVLESRRARAATAGGRVTLTAAGWKLSELLDEIEKQTGNKVVDAREQFGQAETDPPVTLVADNEPFWSVLDQALDQTGLDLYGYGDTPGVLRLVIRQPNRTNRYDSGSYAGPFRFEPTDAIATRGLRNTADRSLRVKLEIAWEPSLQPIALGVPIDAMTVLVQGGRPLATTQPGRVFNIEVQPGTPSIDITLPFELPPRDAGRIESITGTLLALLPGRHEQFVFDNLSSDKPLAQTKGGVEVTLDRVRQNNEIWEVQMQLKLADDNDALASHRSWVFANTTYLEDAEGNTIEHVGFDTTKQTNDTVGITYLFDLPDGIEGMKWVYKTPAAIVSQEFDIELGAIELP